MTPLLSPVFTTKARREQDQFVPTEKMLVSCGGPPRWR
jgi:hypothetical protein